MLVIDRRSLLLAASALAGRTWLADEKRDGTRTSSRPRIRLLLLELNGGNDGLNTLVPLENDDYVRARPVLHIPASRMLALDEQHGLNPGLVELRKEFDRGSVAFVEGVGMAASDRSHFRSLDRWHAASERGREAGDGWIGRLLAALRPDDRLTPHAVHIGASLPFSLQSRTHPALALESASTYRWGFEPGQDNKPELGSPRLEYVRAVRRSAERSCEMVQSSILGYVPRAKYPGSPLGGNLRAAAGLLLGPGEIDVVSVAQTSFDTHNDQLNRYPLRIAELDAALGAFLEDMRRAPAGNDVVVLAYSEFGRRVIENASGGTDHGTAGLAFLCGARVRGGYHGRAPSLSDLADGDLVVTTDLRSLYGAVLRDGFGVAPEAIIAGSWPSLEVLS